MGTNIINKNYIKFSIYFHVPNNHDTCWSLRMLKLLSTNWISK